MVLGDWRSGSVMEEFTGSTLLYALLSVFYARLLKSTDWLSSFAGLLYCDIECKLYSEISY